MLSAYKEIIRIRFLMMLAYRVNYYSGIIIYAVNIGAYYFLWKAIYGSQETLGGLTLTQMTTYIAVSWMARAFYFNNLDREIANEIKDGSVAIQFIRPYNYIIVKMMQGLGEGLFRLLLFTTPGMVLASLLFPVKLPKDPSVWLIFFSLCCFFQLPDQYPDQYHYGPYRILPGKQRRLDAHEKGGGRPALRTRRTGFSVSAVGAGVA